MQFVIRNDKKKMKNNTPKTLIQIWERVHECLRQTEMNWTITCAATMSYQLSACVKKICKFFLPTVLKDTIVHRICLIWSDLTSSRGQNEIIILLTIKIISKFLNNIFSCIWRQIEQKKYNWKIQISVHRISAATCCAQHRNDFIIIIISS